MSTQQHTPTLTQEQIFIRHRSECTLATWREDRPRPGYGKQEGGKAHIARIQEWAKTNPMPECNCGAEHFQKIALRACNSHEALVAALEDCINILNGTTMQTRRLLHWAQDREIPDIATRRAIGDDLAVFSEKAHKINAALSLAKEG